uniref:Tudor domain containing 15 n=1 Tax=Hucho hucho TaxID=62062 RepID=A0A4W5NGH2_9TELE
MCSVACGPTVNGQYLSICELDYNILQVEIQNAQKTKMAVEVGEFCLVEDVLSTRWYRGRVQNKQKDLFDVFLIDHGNVLSVDASRLATALDELFMLPPKILCGFFANVLPLRENWDYFSETYFASLIGSHVKGYIQAFLPHKVLILEAPDINKDLFRLSLGKHVDTDTFLLLVEMLTEVPLKQSIAPVPDLLIEKQGGQEFSFKPSSLKGFEDILSFSGPKLTTGKKVRVRVTAAVNPVTFYCQMTSMAKDLKRMSDKLALSCEFKSKDPSLKPAENMGLLCSVKGKDEKWHRGFVQFLPVNSQVRVLFVDYGFCESVKIENVLQLPLDFLSTPIMAFPCALSCLNGQDEAVTIQQLACFKKGLLGGVLDVEINGFDKEQNLYSVTVLSAEDYAAVEAGAIQDVPGQRECDFVLESEPAFSLNGYLYYETAKIQAMDNSVIVEEMQEDSVTLKDKAPAVKFKAQTFKPGSELVVRCSHVNTPSDFWCQLESKIPDLEDMMEAIQQYYQAHTLPVQSSDSCCVTKSKDDGRWYRACIIGAQKDEVEIIFVDYGIIAKESVHNLQAIVPEFLDLEGQAFRCSLYNLIEPAKGIGSDWGREACDLLKYFAQGRSVKLTCYIHAQLYVKNKGLCNVVDLHNTQQNATKKLVEKGLAREVQTPMHLMPSVCPDSFVHSSFNLRCGSEEQVCVTHVCSPWEMYCQLDRNTEIIEDLMEKVSIESKEILRANSGPDIGKLCLAKYYGDGKWYRGVACPVQSTLLVNVFFVDYGNMHIVEKNNVISIPRHSADLLFTPMQALRCSLSQIPKEDNFADVNKWLEKSILNKPLRAVVAGKNEDGAFFFDLFDGGININEEVKELIASQKPKEKKSSRPVTGHEGHKVGKTKEGQHLKPTCKGVTCHNKHQHQNKKSSNAQKAKCPDAQQDWEEHSERITRLKSEESTEGKTDQHDVDSSSKLTETVFSVQLPKLSQLPPNPKIKSGFRGLGFVSHINTVDSFFIQMQDDEQSILKMGEDLNTELFKETMGNNSTLVDFRMNDLVAAEYEEDGALYRAVVTDNASNDHFKVEFVDYGNTATVTKDKMYTLTSVFLLQHRLSIPCSLLNSDSYKSDASFTDAVMGKPLMVEIVSRFGTQWEVNVEIQQDNPTLDNDVTENEETQTVTPTEKKSNLDNSPQRLFLAPVNMDLGYSGFAAAVTTPSEFNIVLEDLLLIMNTVSTILEDLPKELLPLHEEHVIPGSCCLVRSDSKNKWCRAEIVHSDRAVVVINLVDYGHCVDMPYKDWSELRRLPDQLTRLPKVTYPCTLRGVKSVEWQWTDEAVVFFQECICKKNLQIYFRQNISEAHWEVDIVADGVHVAKDLVDAGHAEYIDIMLGLRFQEQSPIRAPEQKQGLSCAEKTSKVEPEMTPPGMNKLLRRLNEELELDGHTSSEAAFHGQGFEKASEQTARATEYSDGQGAEMTHRSTMTGTRHCKYFHLLIFLLHVG